MITFIVFLIGLYLGSEWDNLIDRYIPYPEDPATKRMRDEYIALGVDWAVFDEEEKLISSGNFKDEG